MLRRVGSLIATAPANGVGAMLADVVRTETDADVRTALEAFVVLLDMGGKKREEVRVERARVRLRSAVEEMPRSDVPIEVVIGHGRLLRGYGK